MQMEIVRVTVTYMCPRCRWSRNIVVQVLGTVRAEMLVENADPECPGCTEELRRLHEWAVDSRRTVPR